MRAGEEAEDDDLVKKEIGEEREVKREVKDKDPEKNGALIYPKKCFDLGHSPK